MCARVIYVLLAGLFIYVTSTIAAFAYLEWWQAILVSMLVFVLMIAIGKALLKRYVRTMGRRASAFLNKRAEVMKGATLEVHSIKPTAMPTEIVDHVAALEAHQDDDEDEPQEQPENYSEFRWHLVEATIFPTDAAPTKRADPDAGVWDPQGLRIVPFEAEKIEFMGFNSRAEETPEFDLWELELVEDGEGVRLDGREDGIVGPRRLRFVVGTPPQYRLLKLQYFTEQFGRIELPVTFGPRSRS